MSERIYFGTIKEGIEPPNLIEVQANSYVDFLQKDVPYSKRKNQGLQAVFKEVFPIESYDEKAVLDFSHYDIGEPKLTALEAQREGQTYSAPLPSTAMPVGVVTALSTVVTGPETGTIVTVFVVPS